MAKVEDKVEVVKTYTFDIVGLTPGEYQVIRNGLAAISEGDSICGSSKIDRTEETQQEAARRLADNVVTYKGGSNG